ncbi:FAD-binding and (Fe-S)-binding domain-containing protein [Mesonia ostreae]|uniref:FAD-linked oxidase C-terminal domain-containing protein n=1 Tax=Mesonia ostreae TaxID=861110 RepID=A0ABU2KI18_9FLAO|nr:FAD-linked oxidase C-terminal domain-containing protein [Mesonia ostreae]MDT0294350.1 FAD-linked oxidase C-terminal domain-containing protein [Mesonia ostreae]
MNLSLIESLKHHIQGELFIDDTYKKLYATDASVYRKMPLGVVIPKSLGDLQDIVVFAAKHSIELVPRAAGTSLAGQCVGEGLVVDISKYLNSVIEFNESQRSVTVEPGIIRDELNRYLEPYDLFFGPNTSTSNRCTLGGMAGNNSSGTTSIQYGVTRDKVLEMEVILSDGSLVTFGSLNAEEFQRKLEQEDFEGEIYKKFYQMLLPKEVQNEIRKQFPLPEIHRRNTGYALDTLIDTEVFSSAKKTFNFCKLLCGSEGTLAFTTKIKLQLDPLPPKKSAMIAAHFYSIEDCLEAVEPVMQEDLFTCEMMDKIILDCTKDSIKYKENRFFIKGDPIGILMLELKANQPEALQQKIKSLEHILQTESKSYANKILYGEEIHLALELRKAGLGLLGNLKGDKKAVACIEDTAVALKDLSSYIHEFTQLMKSFDQKAVYYAHAGAGELHLRPILNLKKSEDVALFKEITHQVALLVKKYKGSFSGEHGDGRVRASFIEMLVGVRNYQLFKQTKSIFDPQNIFNPGKIVEALPMETDLRYEIDRKEPHVKTVMNFEDTQGFLRAVENCNGSGDCRKSVAAGGTMCPSYRATKNEKDTTRGRANMLRELMSQPHSENRFNDKATKEVLDLCISCKGCKSECPSNIDMAAYKAEFLYQYHQHNSHSFRDQLFSENYTWNKRGRFSTSFTNALFENSLSSKLIKRSLGIAPERSLPQLSKKSLRKSIQENPDLLSAKAKQIKKVYLFIDEFTDQLDTSIGLDALEVLTHLGYKIEVVAHEESGRAQISKGFLLKAKQLANKNIEIFKDLVSEESPLIGIEPSAILSFRDEYFRLANAPEKAKKLAKHVFLIEEFLSEEIKKGNITSEQFEKASQTIKIHAHCHQKAMSSIKPTFDILNIPENYKVTVISSGCCGMAGSFGYEKEHYEVSMQIGNHSLFPAVRRAANATIIAANGTSCRHQIYDGTQKKSMHPISILKNALIKVKV